MGFLIAPRNFHICVWKEMLNLKRKLEVWLNHEFPMDETDKRRNLSVTSHRPNIGYPGCVGTEI